MSDWEEIRHTVAIGGTVVSVQSQFPLPGLHVELRVVDGGTGMSSPQTFTPVSVTRTDQHGRFFFLDLPDGQYKLSVTANLRKTETVATVARDTKGSVLTQILQLSIPQD